MHTQYYYVILRSQDVLSYNLFNAKNNSFYSIRIYHISITIIIILKKYALLYFRLYSIIAPNTLRPNSQYHVAVSIHKAPEPVRVKMGIIGSSYSDFKTVEVRPLSTEMVHFEVYAKEKSNFFSTYQVTAFFNPSRYLLLKVIVIISQLRVSRVYVLPMRLNYISMPISLRLWCKRTKPSINHPT